MRPMRCRITAAEACVCSAAPQRTWLRDQDELPRAVGV